MSALIAEYVARVRHRFTVAEARAAAEAGVFGPWPKLELIDGEILVVPADRGRTINWNIAINRWLTVGLANRPDLAIVPDKTLILSDYDAPSPDFYVFPSRIADPTEVRGPDVLLVIEVSDSSLGADLGAKAALYGLFGVREYWVVDCADRRLHVHRLGAEGYGAPALFGPEETVAAALIPGLTLRLADLTRV